MAADAARSLAGMRFVRIGRHHQLWSIQYLRAVAAMAVIVFHLLQGLPLMWLGEHGVDLFFVISGFMMVVMTTGRSVTPGRFMLDRITRIVPLYWAATILAFLIALAGIPLFAASTDFRLLARSLAFIPALDERGQIWPTLYLGWTLNYEMFFYALFSLCLLLPRRWRLTALSATFAILVAIGWIVRPSHALLSVWTNPLLLEFAAGAWLGFVAGPGADKFTPRRMAALMVLIALPLFLFAALSPRLVFGGVAALMIAVGLLVERKGLLPELTFLKRLGDASYSIYLFQAFAFVAVDVLAAAASRATGRNLEMVRFVVPASFLARSRWAAPSRHGWNAPPPHGCGGA